MGVSAAGNSSATAEASSRPRNSSTRLKNASRAQSATSPSRKFKVKDAGPVVPARVTRASRDKFDLKLHSPIKTKYRDSTRQSSSEPEQQKEPASVVEGGDGTVTEGCHTHFRPSPDFLLSSPPPLGASTSSTASIFTNSNPFAKGAGLGFSPEKSPLKHTGPNASPSGSVSPLAKRELPRRDQRQHQHHHDHLDSDGAPLNFVVASPHKRVAQKIFQQPSPVSPASRSAALGLTNPLPVGVSSKRQRDAFQDVPLSPDASTSRSPARKRIGLEATLDASSLRSQALSSGSPQKGALSKNPVFCNVCGDEADLAAVNMLTGATAPTAPQAARLGSSLFAGSELPSAAPSASLFSRPSLDVVASGLAAPAPLQPTSLSYSASDPLIPTSSSNLLGSPKRGSPRKQSMPARSTAASPVRRPVPPKRSNSLSELTFSALAEEQHSPLKNNSRAASPAMSASSPPPSQALAFAASLADPTPSLSVTSATPSSSHVHDSPFASFSPSKAHQQPPSLSFEPSGLLPPVNFEDQAAASAPLPLPPFPVPSSSSPRTQTTPFSSAYEAPDDLGCTFQPLEPAAIADQRSPPDNRASGFPMTVAAPLGGLETLDENAASGSSSSQSSSASFSTEGMSDDQVAKLNRLQSLAARLKPCRRLSTPVPQAPESTDASGLPFVASRLRSGNNAGAENTNAADLRRRTSNVSAVRRGSLLEHASLSSASQALDQHQQQLSSSSPEKPPASITLDHGAAPLFAPPTLPLAGVVVFVDVRTSEGDDASSVFIDMLKSLGARVLGKHTNLVTHIVFKAGRPATLQRAKICSPQPDVVGIGWVVKTKETVSSPAG